MSCFEPQLDCRSLRHELPFIQQNIADISTRGEARCPCKLINLVSRPSAIRQIATCQEFCQKVQQFKFIHISKNIMSRDIHV